MTAPMTAEGMPLPPATVEGQPADERRRRRKAILLLFLLGLLAMLTTLAIWYLLFRQPITPPIPIIPEAKVPAYSTAIYGASGPLGVAVSASGDRIYVTQSTGDVGGIVFDGSGNKIGTMTPPEATGANHAPVYVAIDPLTQEVYTSDRLAGTIYVYNRDGTYQRELRLAEPRPGWQPLGLAFDKAGNLYVTDLSGPTQKVLVLDRSAKVIRTIGDKDGLSFPNGVGVDDAGNVYVADGNTGRVIMVDPQGVIRGQVGRGAGEGNLGLPRGVTVDGSGRVFVADATGQNISIYRAPATDRRVLDFQGSFGTQGAADGQFQYPTGVAVDARGRVYVADTFNDRVQIWSY